VNPERAERVEGEVEGVAIPLHKEIAASFLAMLGTPRNDVDLLALVIGIWDLGFILASIISEYLFTMQVTTKTLPLP